MGSSGSQLKPFNEPQFFFLAKNNQNAFVNEEIKKKIQARGNFIDSYDDAGGGIAQPEAVKSAFLKTQQVPLPEIEKNENIKNEKNFKNDKTKNDKIDKEIRVEKNEDDDMFDLDQDPDRETFGSGTRSGSMENVFMDSSNENLGSADFDSVSTEVTPGTNRSRMQRRGTLPPPTPMPKPQIPKLLVNDLSTSLPSNLNDLKVEEVT